MTPQHPPGEGAVRPAQAQAVAAGHATGGGAERAQAAIGQAEERAKVGGERAGERGREGAGQRVAVRRGPPRYLNSIPNGAEVTPSTEAVISTKPARRPTIAGL